MSMLKVCDKHGLLKPEDLNTQNRCRECVKERARFNRQNNLEKYRGYDKKWRSGNLEKARIQNILQKRNLTYSEYIGMKEKQNNKCAICHKEETMVGRTLEVMPLAVDHCHRCERHIRELLCGACNTAIGKANESIDVILKAIAYLEKHNHVE